MSKKRNDFNLNNLFRRLFSFNRADLHKKIVHIIDPVNNKIKVNPLEQIQHNTANFRMFIVRDCLGKRRR